MTCERCNKETKPDGYDLFDFCAKCARNLCPECMKKGCCGEVPAKSGMNEEDPDFNEKK